MDLLLRATGHDARDSAQPWAEIEAELGTELPRDSEELCQAFGVGEFSRVVSVLCTDETRVVDLLRMWRVLLDHDAPSDGPVDAWPVLAKMEAAKEWDRYEMSATEFLYRILTGPGFRPYTAADAVPEPIFEPV
ncbi:hypothetical protein ABT288_36550 [Streptomyces sp. NPDC001093]|uniref:hypothetical protein n=1 Tax=Streptomyces sp. NPDC001093 TaxID=3154376 RepID=UPI00332E0AA2